MVSLLVLHRHNPSFVSTFNPSFVSTFNLSFVSAEDDLYKVDETTFTKGHEKIFLDKIKRLINFKKDMVTEWILNWNMKIY